MRILSFLLLCAVAAHAGDVTLQSVSDAPVVFTLRPSAGGEGVPLRVGGSPLVLRAFDKYLDGAWQVSVYTPTGEVLCLPSTYDQLFIAYGAGTVTGALVYASPQYGAVGLFTAGYLAVMVPGLGMFCVRIFKRFTLPPSIE